MIQNPGGGAINAVQPTPVGYLMAAFNQPGAAAGDSGPAWEAASLYFSGDGVGFSDVGQNPAIWLSPGLRDPSIIKIGGTWFLTATNNSISNSYVSSTFPIYQSTDLQTWTLVTTINPGLSNKVWAPSFYQDPTTGSIYIFFTNNEATYYWIRATDTIGLAAWSAPVAITIAGLPANTTAIFDTSIILIGSTYHVFITTTNGSGQGGVSHYTAVSPTGTWTLSQGATVDPSNISFNGYSGYLEGAFVVQVGPSAWRLYADASYGEGAGYFSTTDPTLATWSGAPTFTPLRYNGQVNNGRFRHPGVVPLMKATDALSLAVSPSSSARYRPAPSVAAGPASLPDLVAHYDATQIASPPAEGGSLATWPDLSANHWDLTQAVGASQPLYYAATAGKTINGKAAVWFNGTSTLMSTVSFPFALWPFTVFVVVAAAATGQDGEIFDNLARGLDTSFQQESGGNRWEAYGGASFYTGAVDTNAHSLAVVFNGLQSWIWVDGVAALGSTSSSLTLPPNTMNGLRIGARAGVTPDTYLNGAISELFIIGAALPAPTVAVMQKWLIAKWATPIAP